MADRSMEPSESFYVAEAEPPPPRRPPVTEVGLIKWMRDNLFSTPADIFLTLFTLVVVVLAVVSFLDWTIFRAQWEVVFLNLRALSLGNLFPQSEIWRGDLIVAIIVFLTFFSVAIWGRLTRTIILATLVILAAMWLIPPLSQGVEEPTVHVWTQPNFQDRYVSFPAEAGQTVEFTIDPLTEVEDYDIASLAGSYVENDNQQGNTSFDGYNVRVGAVQFQGADPSTYDLNMRLVLYYSTFPVAQTPFTGGSSESITAAYRLPRTGWYTVVVEYDEENPGTEGAAWLELNNIEVYRSTSTGRQELLEAYGTQPEREAIADCTGCVTAVNRTDMRFEGRRNTFGQFLSLQLAPFLLETRGLFLNMAIVGLIGYFLGKMSRGFSMGSDEGRANVERTLALVGGGLIFLYFGIQVTLLGNPLPSLEGASFAVFVAVMLVGLAYALVQFAKEDPAMAGRGLTLLWLLSIPLMWTLLTGFEVPATAEGVSPVNIPLPEISSQSYGGMLLTLLLSAVAIIASFPLGVLLALGRTSSLPIVSLLCTVFIEVIRGVPLITLLFFGRFILPFFGFGLQDVDLVIRVMVMLTLFMAAYLAEVVRGGLQIIPKGQVEAAQALGLNNFYTTILIILPQALRAVIPAIMGQAVSLFKDTSLVFIVGLFEVLGTMNQILGDAQTGYTLSTREGYLYVGLAYFVFSYLMADISRRIERTGAGAFRRG